MRKTASKLLNVGDYRKAARRRLPRMLFDFVDGGALEERTLGRNSLGYGDVWLRGRSFRSTGTPSLETDILGMPAAMPLMLAPTGASGLLWPRGEAAAAAAAAARNVIMQVSAGSILSMEEIAAASNGHRWLQIFLYKDRGITSEFLARARQAGYSAICVTTDAPVHGKRERDARNGFTIDRKLTLRSLFDAAIHCGWWLRMSGQPKFSMKNFEGRSTGSMVDMAAYIASVLDPEINWDDLSWLREQWDGPLIVKGILHGEDAKEAVSRGADAVQVSNHGGRQLDSTIATIDALPEIVDAVQGKVPIFIDGGISNGVQVLKALALGASACVIGRAYLWGMAAAGQAGVEEILDIIADEMRNAMVIGGWKSVKDLDATAVARLPLPSQGQLSMVAEASSRRIA
jgi:isopentenyl diphosphate isomerase/L-lactate dehydrogenase-like FMN-dependent dehydrogenase